MFDRKYVIQEKCGVNHEWVCLYKFNRLCDAINFISIYDSEGIEPIRIWNNESNQELSLEELYTDINKHTWKTEGF